MSQGFIGKIFSYLSNPPKERLDLSGVNLDGKTVQKIDQFKKDNEIRSKREEIELFFKELKKLQVKRDSMSRNEKTGRKSITEDIAEGIRDLEAEVAVLSSMLDTVETKSAETQVLTVRLQELLNTEDGNTGWNKADVYNTQKDSCELSGLNETGKLE